MTKPIQIQSLGSLLSILLDDGTTLMAYPTVGDVWLTENNTASGADTNTYTVQAIGNSLNIVSSNNNYAIAYPTNGNIFIVDSTNFTIGGGTTPPGGTGGTGTVNDWEWPMDTSRWMISSPYGPRTSPYVGFHYGIDITGSGVTGVPVWAVSAGTVITNTYNSRAGYWVMLSHPDGTRTQYMHFPTYGPVPVGTNVVKGQLIGHVGASGDSTGAHLHFQTQDTSNIAMDPILYMRARGHEFGEVQPT